MPVDTIIHLVVIVSSTNYSDQVLSGMNQYQYLNDEGCYSTTKFGPLAT